MRSVSLKGRDSRRRRGIILPLVAVGMIALLALAALAVDLGRITVARTQCQAAADSAALSGARTLNGSRDAGAAAGDPISTADNNYADASPRAVSAAASNSVLGTHISSGDVHVTVGKYYYDIGQNRFVSYPLESGSVNDAQSNWSLVQATVSYGGQNFFASFLGLSPFSVQASATAVHRPRDVSLVLDFSGSMRFSSELGVPYNGNQWLKSNNPDPIFPKFGHYSDQSGAGLQQTTQVTTTSGWVHSASNITASVPLDFNRTPLVTDFYSKASGSLTAGFSSAGAGDSDGYVGGDRPMKPSFNSGSGYAKTLKDLLNLGSVNTSTVYTSFENQDPLLGGYDMVSLGAPKFQGYTQGPAYWGKTFFYWPPDPRKATDTSSGSQHNNGALDWRQRFFLQSDGATPVDDNALLWDSSGSWRSPTVGGTNYYRINYRAIIDWLVNTGPNPFPIQLRAGRILYYDAFPDSHDNTLNTRFWNFNPNSPSGLSNNERFWKDYIDYALGLSQSGASTWYTASGSKPNSQPFIGYGDDYAWSGVTTKITAKSSLSGTPKPYMNYDDSPIRPRTHFWFGPMNMVDFLSNWAFSGLYSSMRYTMAPGTAHEAPMYSCKVAINAALKDIENNHPNDAVSLIFYSRPRSSAGDTGNRFNRVRVPLGRNYQRMSDSLFFPPSTLSAPNSVVSPYANDGMEVPRAAGATCYSMGLMLAFNQFSGNPTLRTFNPAPALNGDAGGLGRKGAQKIVIFETDGMPNTTASASVVTSYGPSSANYSYYAVRYNESSPGSSEYPSTNQYSNNDSAVTSQIYGVANRLCALETDSNPGFSTSHKPVKLHCIAFGPVFDPASPSRDSGLATLQQIERIGNTQLSSTPSNWLPDYKIVTGDDASVAAKLRAAISTILQDGVQVSLID